MLRYDSLRIFGSEILPLISEKDLLLQKLIRYHHAPPRTSNVGIHETQLGTIAAMQRGLFGSFNPYIKRLVAKFITHCKNCNVAREIHYSDIPLGSNSVKTSMDEKVFTNMSIDPLGGLHVHPFSGGRNIVEIFPLLVACKTTGGVECILMDGVKTKNILLALQEMEACYSPIKKVTCDAGSNLINISSQGLNSGEHKMLSKLEMVNHVIPNSQQRNYVERRIQTFKRYERTAFTVPKRNDLPILSLQEIRTTFKKIVRHINEVPFSVSPGDGLISPGTFIYPDACLSDMSCGEEISILHGYSASAVKLQQHLDIFMEIWNQIFVDAKRFLHKSLKIRGQRKGITGARI